MPHKMGYFAMLLVLLWGCASVPRVAVAPEQVVAPLGLTDAPPGVLGQVQERNRTLEDDPRWIEQAYKGLRIKNLKTINYREYPFYKRYVAPEGVYILVHPAFFSFFHAQRLRGGPQEERNVVERLLALPPRDAEMALLQAQERRTRDFLEIASTQRKLVILILPRRYKRYKGYVYRKGPDEYTRYLNEVTNESPSVLYLESRSATRGYLRDAELAALVEFLAAVDAPKVLIGGGYIGRCLEDFYAGLTEDYGEEGIYIVPELSDVSPTELNARLAAKLLTKEGLLNPQALTIALRKDVYNVQDVRPQVYNLSK